MSSGPRKFSEKIALLNQKQTEQNAAFYSIMDEVKSILPSQQQQPNTKVQQNTFLNSPNSYIGGSNTQNFQSNNSNKDMLNEIITETGHRFTQSGFTNKDNIRNSPNLQILGNDENINFSCDYDLTASLDTNIKPFSLNNKNFPIQQKPNQTDHHVSNSSFLQLPSQSDSFRRAHSDSSLHQSSAGNINNANLNQTNNQSFHNTIKFVQNDNMNNTACFGMIEQPNSLPNNNQTIMTNFNVSNYQETTHSLPLSYGNYQNFNNNMQNQIDLSIKTSNSLMPHGSINNSQNTFASLPDLTTFNYTQNEFNIQDNPVMANNHQHNLVGPLKPTHYSTSPTRITARYSPTNSNRRLSPQRSDKYPSPIQNLNLRNNYGIQTNNMAPSNMYRNNNPNESLPPSPQSQQSCFNSPQGSPGPHSISPQDINPFTCNNYESMQKKFDMFNLEPTHSPYNSFNNTQNVLPVSKGILNGSNTCIPQNSSLQNNCNNSMDDTSNDNNPSVNNLSPQCPNMIENISFNKQLLKGNSQMLQNNSNINNNSNNNNRGNELIENTDIRANFSQPATNCDNGTLGINSTQIYCSSNMNNSLHKNSIPDIILTSFSDSVEDNVLQSNLYSDCNTKDSLDFEQLQIFGESVESQDGLTLDSISQQILEYPENDP